MDSLGLSRNFVIGQILFFVGFAIMALFFLTPWRSCPDGACPAVPSDTIGFVVGAVLGFAGIILTFTTVLRRNKG
ncbi:MAG TPA: hypothetical protein GXZ30_09610 [Propionibacterium sp.]|jgi:membrane-associated PAP2 superfamily phosphatase|nr:hypothetical protein [Propionibacterium sp.]